MDFIQKNIRGFLLCLLIALPCQYLGNKLPLIGGPVFGILAGMVITRFLPFKETFKAGITFTSKKILQYSRRNLNTIKCYAVSVYHQIAKNATKIINF